jgi:hypothetical protein
MSSSAEGCRKCGAAIDGKPWVFVLAATLRRAMAFRGSDVSRDALHRIARLFEPSFWISDLAATTSCSDDSCSIPISACAGRGHCRRALSDAEADAGSRLSPG